MNSQRPPSDLEQRNRVPFFSQVMFLTAGMILGHGIVREMIDLANDPPYKAPNDHFLLNYFHEKVSSALQLRAHEICAAPDSSECIDKVIHHRPPTISLLYDAANEAGFCGFTRDEFLYRLETHFNIQDINESATFLSWQEVHAECLDENFPAPFKNLEGVCYPFGTPGEECFTVPNEECLTNFAVDILPNTLKGYADSFTKEGL